MADDDTGVIEYTELPDKNYDGRRLKWAKTLLDIQDNCPDGQFGKVAVKETETAASGLGQTLRDTVRKVDDLEDFVIRVRRVYDDDGEHTGEFSVLAAPASKHPDEKPSTNKSGKKGKSKSKKSSGKSRRRKKSS